MGTSKTLFVAALCLIAASSRAQICSRLLALGSWTDQDFLSTAVGDGITLFELTLSPTRSDDDEPEASSEFLDIVTGRQFVDDESDGEMSPSPGVDDEDDFELDMSPEPVDDFGGFFVSEGLSLKALGVVPKSLTGLNPAYCDVGEDKSILYCINENNPGGSTIAVKLPALTMNGSLPSGVPILTGTVMSTPTGELGDGPAHVAKLSNGVVVASTYHGSSLVSYVEDVDGALIFADVFKGPNDTFSENAEQPFNQPRFHQAVEIEDGVVVVQDLGTNIVWEFSVDVTGAVTELGKTSVNEGDGPRHAAFDARSGTLYVVAEVSLFLIEMRRGCNGSGQTFGVCGRYPLLPDQGDFAGNTFVNGSASAIRLSEDARFVYAGVRRETADQEEGAIVAFALNDGHVGERLGPWGSGGIQPRDFVLVEGKDGCGDGKYLLLTINRDTNNLVVFARDQVTGAITDKLAAAQVASPTSVLVVS